MHVQRAFSSLFLCGAGHSTWSARWYRQAEAHPSAPARPSAHFPRHRPRARASFVVLKESGLWLSSASIQTSPLSYTYRRVVHLSTIVIGDVARPRPGHGSFSIEPEIRNHSATSARVTLRPSFQRTVVHASVRQVFASLSRSRKS